MKNSIAERIADFLHDYAPFSELSHEELTNISTEIRVINLEKNTSLFQINDILHNSFYVVASGIINLSTIADAEEKLLNTCSKGDILGLRPFFAKNNYMMTAKAKEDSIVYGIPIAVFRPFVAQNAEVLDFLLQSFASTAQISGGKNNKNLIKDAVQYGDSQTEIQYYQSFDYNRNPVCVQKSAIVQNVAQQMTDNMSSSVIVHEDNLPVGIITDSDLRIKIATGKFYLTTLVSNVMVMPTIVPENISLSEAQLLILRNNVSHLCVTVDGTNQTAIKGVISQFDLIAAQANNPGVLIKQIKQSTTIDELKNLREKLSEFVRISIEKRIAISHINSIVGEINIAINSRIVSLVILEIGSAPARFSWFCIGSQGRKEQLLLTDQDNMLVFEDVAADKYQEVKDYFLMLSSIVNKHLETIGYAICPFGNVAKNIFWCKSVSDWIKQFDLWINTPGENADQFTSLFFDFEFAYGDQKFEALLSDHIIEVSRNKKKFFAFLGTNAIDKPAALNFFKNFNLEEEGTYKDLFNIKQRAYLPFVDCARVLALNIGLKGVNNTYLRFKQLAMHEPKYSEIYNEAADNFLSILKFKTSEGLKNNSSGEYVNIDEMTKTDREKLKNCVSSLKDLEEIIKNKFSLTYFS